MRSLLLVSALLGACGSSRMPTAPAGNDIGDLIVHVQVAGLVAQVERRVGAPPAPGTGPASTVTGPMTVINGGTLQVTLDGSSSFGSATLALAGAQGYYVVTLPDDVASVDLLLTLAQELGRTNLDFQVAAGDGDAVGAYGDVQTAVAAVGTGDLQISVSWDVDSDVDLHVIDPDGDEVFFADKRVLSGGTLDLDSNSACVLDHVRNENITWAQAVPGLYTVLVEYSDSCGMAATNYVVTLQRKGQDPETFTGQLTGDGDGGGAGNGVEVTTFTVP